MAQTPTPVNRTKLCDHVSDRLLHEIVSGSLTSDQPLPNEANLSQQFGVSRSAIRECMKILSTRGMVTVRQGAGTFVTDSSRWKVIDDRLLLAMNEGHAYEELLDARLNIEPIFSGLAARNATTQELDSLAVTVENDGQVLDAAEARRCDRDFHNGITKATHNFVFVVMMDSINLLMDRSRTILAQLGTHEMLRSVNEHREIFKYISNRDSHSAENAMRDHLLHVRQQMKLLSREASAGTHPDEDLANATV